MENRDFPEALDDLLADFEEVSTVEKIEAMQERISMMRRQLTDRVLANKRGY